MGIQEYIDSLSSVMRARTLKSDLVKGYGVRYIDGIQAYEYRGTAAYGTREEVNSLENPLWAYRHQLHLKLQESDIGGPFFHRKVTLTPINSPSHSLHSGTATWYYHQDGPVQPPAVYKIMEDIYKDKLHVNTAWTSDNALSRADLRAEGLKLMLRAVPTTPAYNAANSIGELISEQALFGIPLKSVLDEDQLSKGLAGEYLNLQFGILPVISDVQNYFTASNKAEQVIAQFMKDANKVVRRKRRLPTQRTTTSSTTTDLAVTSLQMVGGTVVPTALHRQGKLTTTRRFTRDIWFSGAFKSFLPPNTEDWYLKLRQYNAVYGVIPSIQTAWELTPFSWLVDYFTNAQDFIRGAFLAGSDGSVLVRGYVMCKTHVITEYTWSGDLAINGYWIPHTLTWKVEETIHQRERTRAYGVDWSGVGLSAKQFSILTALGISLKKG